MLPRRLDSHFCVLESPVDKEGMDKKERDPDQITLFQSIPAMIIKDGVYNMDFLKEKVRRENRSWTDPYKTNAN